MKMTEQLIYTLTVELEFPVNQNSNNVCEIIKEIEEGKRPIYVKKASDNLSVDDFLVNITNKGLGKRVEFT